MNENRLEITKEQFDNLISLPAVKNTFTYFIRDYSEKVGGKIVNVSVERSILFAGVEFVVPRE